MKNSLKNLFGQTLDENGYKMIYVNQYRKKYKKYRFYLNREMKDKLLLRLLYENEYGKTSCIVSDIIDNIPSFSSKDFSKIITESEKYYLEIIQNSNTKIQ